MSGQRKMYRMAHFALYFIAMVMPYFVLSMSVSAMSANPKTFLTYGWIIAPYIWFTVHGTLIPEQKRGPWIVSSLIIIPGSLYFYYFISKSYASLFLYSPAAVLITGLVLFNIFSSVFQNIFPRKKDDVISVHYDRPEK